MRTNIVINDDLKNQALAVSGLKSKMEAVENGLKLLVKMKQQEQIHKARGKLQWEGDLEQIRSDN
ncbi:MAG: type II toxin-antitoxin system VapB family antitoxin [Magnetococcales bacterium]|nr:type II toxin-antitoxin system VapB family antitoxin [Magnetococcales bacterium]